MAKSRSSLSVTDWSLLGRLQHGDEAVAAEALERLARRYWPAVYVFVRRAGRDVHEAADLTQSFLTDVVLGRDLLKRADRSKGRFRQLLLRSLRNYLRERRRFEQRAKRMPRDRRLVPLSEDADIAATVDGASSPDDAFHSAWSRTLVQRVLGLVRAECLRDGLEPHWRVFDARVVQPAMHGAAPVGFDAIARALDLPSAAHAANLAATVKRRFARTLRKEIAETVIHMDDVEPEVREILDLIERRQNRARPNGE